MKTMSIIYNYENVDRVSTINEKQVVETSPKSTKIVQIETINPEDPEDPIIENITENVAAIKEELFGEDLMEWFINNNLIISGETIIDYFLVDSNLTQPTTNIVNNVDYIEKTWENNAIDIDLYKSNAIQKIKEYAQSISKQFTKGVPDDEVKSWGRKEIAASNHLSGVPNSSDTIILQSEADLTGESLTELATKISANSQIYLPVIGKIAGIRRSTTNAIMDELITTTEQIDLIISNAKLLAETELQDIITAIQGT